MAFQQNAFQQDSFQIEGPGLPPAGPASHYEINLGLSLSRMGGMALSLMTALLLATQVF